jgi:hypothetical protein
MIKLINPNINQVGFSTLEILIVIFLISIIASSSILVASTSQSILFNSQLRSEAINLAQYEINAVKVLANNNFFDLTDSESTDRQFHIQRLVKDISRFSKQAEVTVSWLSNNKVQKVEQAVLLVDKDNLGADTCSLDLSSSWTSPQVIFTVPLPTPYILTSIEASGDYIYISVDSSVRTDPDLIIFDVSDRLNPKQISLLDTGPGIASLSLAGQTLYAANTSSTAQLQIINVANKNSPVLIKQLKLPGVIGSVAGTSVYFYHHLLYIGTIKNNGPELFVLDVSNPDDIKVITQVELDTQVNDIVAYNKSLYVATPNQKQLRVFEITTSSSLIERASFSSSGFQTQDGKSLDILGSHVFLGRTVGGFNNPNNHELFKLKDDGSILNSIYSKDIAASVRSIFVRDGLIFLGTNYNQAQFQVWVDLGSAVQKISELALPSSVNDLDCSDDLFYVVMENGKGFSIISN